jgi:3-hydroxyisobutyrate dehydrogenase
MEKNNGIGRESGMARIGFVGLGNMGLPMAKNLLKAGHAITGHDASPKPIGELKAEGGATTPNLAKIAGSDIVITMLPAGQHVRDVYLDPNGLIAKAKKGTLFIDCSTIDVETARLVAARAEEAGMHFLDAPVSGGVGGAQGATLTFMVGGRDEVFALAKPIFEQMGKTVVHAGGAGTGQAAKICNNMILGISMIAVSEAFLLAEKLGLDKQKLFDISSKSSGQCWSMTGYCPVPGPVPSSPANRDYAAGFTAAMMLKDLNLARDAAELAHAKTPLGAEAAAIYAKYVESGEAGKDFSGVIQFLRK